MSRRLSAGERAAAPLSHAFTLASQGRIPAAVVVAGDDPAGTPATPLQQASLALLRGITRMAQSDHETALREVLQALPVVEASEYSHQLAWAYSAVGACMGALGDPERGLEWVGRAVALAEHHEQSLNLLKARSDQGWLLGLMHEHAQACAVLDQALAIAARLAVPFAHARCLNNLASAWLLRAEGLTADRHAPTADAPAAMAVDSATAQRQAAHTALAHADQALAIAQGGQVHHAATWAQLHRGRALMLLNEWPGAEAALAQAGAATNAELQVQSRLAQARLRRRQGQREAARALIEQALADAEAQGFALAQTALLHERVSLETEAGALAEALRWAERRHAHAEAQMRRRSATVARWAESFADAERARLEVQTVRAQAQALASANRQLERKTTRWMDAALHDSLTQTYNRRGLARQGRLLWDSGQALAVVAIDADHFKQVNDRHGHAVGDQVLQRLATLIHAHCRASDVLARIGGEEFLLLLPGAASEPARARCESIRQHVAQADWGSIAPELQLTVSLGLALRGNHVDFNSLLADADAAMYVAKADGRNCVRQA